MKQHRIIIHFSNISQAEADIKALRASGTEDTLAAAQALEDAVGRARPQALCPDLYEAGSLFPQRDEILLEEAVGLFRPAA